MPDATEAGTATTTDAETTDATTATTDTSTTDAATTTATNGDEFKDADRAALTAVVEKERQARRDADKKASDAQKELDRIAAEKLSDTEKLQKRADDAEAKVSTATEKLRKANLLSALGDQGLSGAKAKAAVRLLDGVEFNDDDEPTNLADAVKAAAKEYGEDTFKATSGRVAGDADAGKGDSAAGSSFDDVLRRTAGRT